MELLSERFTSAKHKPNEVADVNEENKDGAGADERAPLLVLVGGGGHMQVVSCAVRLGVLNMFELPSVVCYGSLVLEAQGKNL
jgi:hypothetical protein